MVEVVHGPTPSRSLAENDRGLALCIDAGDVQAFGAGRPAGRVGAVGRGKPLPPTWMCCGSPITARCRGRQWPLVEATVGPPMGGGVGGGSTTCFVIHRRTCTACCCTASRSLDHQRSRARSVGVVSGDCRSPGCPTTTSPPVICGSREWIAGGIREVDHHNRTIRLASFGADGRRCRRGATWAIGTALWPPRGSGENRALDRDKGDADPASVPHGGGRLARGRPPLLDFRPTWLTLPLRAAAVQSPSCLAIVTSCGWRGDTRIEPVGPAGKWDYEASYGFVQPGSGWQRAGRLKDVQVAWVHRRWAALIEIHSQCAGHGDSSLTPVCGPPSHRLDAVAGARDARRAPDRSRGPARGGRCRTRWRPAQARTCGGQEERMSI